MVHRNRSRHRDHPRDASPVRPALARAARASLRAWSRYCAIGDPMPPKLPPFLHHEISRHGRPIWYFRRGHARRIRLPGEYGSAEFLAAYDAALGGGAKGHKSPPSGSFAWGLSLYRQSQTWGALSPATRRKRDNIFARIAKTHGETTLSAWKPGDIAAGRDTRTATP